METITTPVKRGDKGKDVKLVQEWLCLHDVRLGIDGDFGPATERSVAIFQDKHNLPPTGIVNREMWDYLVAPMVFANTMPVHSSSIGSVNKLMVYFARQHLVVHPREVGGENRGPWVRLYCQGHDGAPWAWCCGFVSFIYDQACMRNVTKKELKYTLSCDDLANQAGKLGILENSAYVKPKPGDLFLNRKSRYDWTHTGIIVNVSNEYMITIEGNTNDEGSREGYEVCKRTRGYSTSRDLVLIHKLHGEINE